MKEYPKSEKEIICFECKKPILSRDDFMGFKQKTSFFDFRYLPIHVDCFGRTIKRTGKKPWAFIPTGDMRMFKYMRFIAIPIFIFGIARVIMSPPNLPSSLPLMPFFILFLGAYMFIVSLVRDRKYKTFLEEFEQYLPGSCERCTKTIPPEETVCAACGWKYGQSEKKQKLKH